MNKMKKTAKLFLETKALKKPALMLETTNKTTANTQTASEDDQGKPMDYFSTGCQ